MNINHEPVAINQIEFLLMFDIKCQPERDQPDRDLVDI